MADRDDEIERLRTERDEWRRRAEVAEAVAAERLARTETAERALRTAEAALGERPPAQDTASGPEPAEPAEPAEPKRPASLIERWRRYTETIN